VATKSKPKRTREAITIEEGLEEYSPSHTDPMRLTQAVEEIDLGGSDDLAEVIVSLAKDSANLPAIQILARFISQQRKQPLVINTGGDHVTVLVNISKRALLALLGGAGVLGVIIKLLFG